MVKIYLTTILISLAILTKGQTAASLNIAQSNPLRTIDSDNVMGVIFDGSAYRMYAFNKWSVFDTVGKFATISKLIPYKTKVQNDLLYQPIGSYITSSSLSSTLSNYVPIPTYTSGMASKENSIAFGSTSQYYRGDKTWQNLDKGSVGLNNVDNTSDLSKPVSTATQTALNGKQTTLSLTTTGTGASTLIGNTLNIPLSTSYTAGTGISIVGGIINNTSPDQTVNLTGSNGITTSGTYPNFTVQQTAPTYNNAPARALTTSFRPSTTRPTRVSYTVSIATTLSLLNLNSSGTVALQISPDNSTWTTINSAGVTKTLAVSISVGLNDTSLLNVAGEIPSGYYCRLLPTTSGGSTVTFSSGQEIIY